MSYITTSATGAVSLAELKEHLRIDYNDEDSMLGHYITAATAQAEAILHREIIYRSDAKSVCKTLSDVPPSIKQYILLTAGDMYAHRENLTAGGVNTFFDHLLDAYIIYDRYED